MSFKQKLENIILKNNSLLCIGLDPDLEKLPKYLLNKQNPVFEFNKAIIDSTHDLVCAYKPNIAFYASLGLPGLKALIETISYIHYKHPLIPVILDAKRADISSTSKHYALEVFDVYHADAVTVNPYLGLDSLIPFLERKDKGVFILCKTSNKGAVDFQDLKVSSQKLPIYLYVVRKVIEWNNVYGNCMLVVGATFPEELKKIRKTAPDLFILSPGIGAQSGDLKKTVKAGVNKDKNGIIFNASRKILYAKNPKQEAYNLKNQINSYRYG